MRSDVDSGLLPETCDKTRRPILFVHGYFGGGDNFELQAQRFTSNGYCRAAIRTFDYDSYGTSDTNAIATNLDTAVDALRTASGFATIDLVGHSRGTLVSLAYLSDATHAGKIAHYAQAAGGGLPEPVPQVNLSSDGDHIAGPRKMAPTGPSGTPADNPDIGYRDHVAVLTCQPSFAAMYQLFNGTAPTAPDVVAEQHIEVAGFYRDFSDNAPHPGVTLGVFELDAATGERLRASPDIQLTTGTDGSFGPFVAKPGARYEFFEPEAGEPTAAGAPGRPEHTYRGPFVRSTHLMYLKAFPKPGSAAASLLGGKITYTDSRSGLLIQNSNRAMISAADPGGHGADSLTANGMELLTAPVAPESKTLIALFALDANQTPLTPIASLSQPFLNGIDLVLSSSASDSSPIELVFDKVTVHVHRWKGDSEGASLIVLDN